MVIVVKSDYVNVKVINEIDKTLCADCDKYSADIEYNNKHYLLYGYNLSGKSANDIVKDLYVKVNALYRYIDNDNKQNAYNEILLTIAELIFRLRIDLGVNQ